MSSIKYPNQYYVKVTINKVEVKPQELLYLLAEQFLGNVMSVLTLRVKTDNAILKSNLLLEMSIIEVEIGITDENNAVKDKNKYRYFLSKIENWADQYEGHNGMTFVSIKGVADAYKFLGGEVKIQALGTKGNVSQFAAKTSGVGSGAKGTGTIKLVTHDGLASRALDKQYWIQYDTSGIENFNIFLMRNLIQKGSPEKVITSSIGFNKTTGNPEIHLYDVKLRTSTFKEKFKFSFKGGDDETLRYDNIKLDIKGADYSQQYWKRISANFDIEENTYWAETVTVPKLFKDSADYIPQEEFDGNNGTPSGMTIFESSQRFSHEFYNSNMYGKEYASQKIQTIATLMALRKVNAKVSFPNNFIDVKPIDIVNITWQKADQERPQTINKQLTGNYMVTYVAHEYSNQLVNTHVIASRDSYISK